MKSNKTNIILIISTVTFVALLGCLLYLFRSIENKNKHMSVVLSTLQAKIAEKDNLINLEKRITELDETSKKIDGYFVDTSNIDTFVEYLENLGSQNNTELVVNSVDIPKNENNKIILTLSMKGGFPDVVKVISILENAPYSITFNSLYLNKNEQPSYNQILNTSKTTISNKSYWQANFSINVLSF